MVSFEFIKPDMYSVKAGKTHQRMFVCSPSSVGGETPRHQLGGG